MNQLNSLIIEGNVTRDPEFKETANGHKICNIPVAVNRFYKNADGEGVNEVSFFNIETFGKMAEACQKNCEKGRGLRVVGRLKQNRWTNSDGKTASRVSIIAEHVEFKKRLSSEPAATTSEQSGASEKNLKAMQEANLAAASEEIQEQIPEEAMVF